MAKVRQEFEFDDSGLLDALKEISKAAEDVDQAFDKMQGTSDEMSKGLKKDLDGSKKSIDGYNKEVEQKSKVEEENKRVGKEWQQSIKDSARDVNIMGVNVGQTADKITSFGRNLGSSTASIGGASKALRVFKVALASTGIGLLIVALGSLVAYFTKSQRGLDKLNLAFSGIKAVIDVVIDRIASVGEGFASIISGDFRKGFNQIKESFSGIGAEINKVNTSARELEKRTQALRVAQRALSVEEANLGQEIEKTREESRKSGLTQQERIVLIEKASKLESELATKRLVVAKEEHAIMKESNALSDSKNADLDAEAALLVKVTGIETARARSNRRLEGELRSLRNQGGAESAARAKQIEDQLKAEKAEVESLKESYIDLVKSIEDKLQAQLLSRLEGRALLAEQQRIAIEEINLLEVKAKALAISSEQEYTLGEKFLELRRHINEEFAKEARALVQLTEPLKAADKNVNAAGQRAAEEIAKGMKTGFEKSEGAFKDIRSQMAEWLNLNDDEIRDLEDAFVTTLNVIGDAYSNSIDSQIDENKRYIDSLREQEDILQNQLDRELRLQEDGRANNVEGKRKELEAIRKEEEKAQKEAEKLQRRQQAAALAANAIKQVSNLATAVTEILTSTVGIPFAGIGMAAAAIGGMYSLFAQAKAQASSATGQRAYKGGRIGGYFERDSGFVKKGGRSDIPGRGDGYRILGTDTVVGGDEFFLNEGTSRAHEDFLTYMNTGALDKIDLSGLVNKRSSMGVDEMNAYNRLTSIRGKTIERKSRQYRDSVLVDSVNKNFRELINVTKKRMNIMSIEDHDRGYVMLDDYGNVKKVNR